MLPTNLLVFTDLDGTLLDHHNYSCAPATEALEELARRGVPLVLATSKTRAEVELLQAKLDLTDPFITENGGGIFCRNGYFPGRLEGSLRVGRYQCLALARPYAEITQQLEELSAESGADAVGFHQMSAREIAQNTGLPLPQAELARRREFDEPFFFAGATERAIEKFKRLAGERGLELTEGGRFWHLFAGSDKGLAVRKLISLFAEKWHRRPRVLSLGDSANDVPMLAATAKAVLLPKPDGSFDAAVLARLPRIQRGSFPGPAGWNQAVLEFLKS